MLRDIHFFHLKPGAGEDLMLHQLDHDSAEDTRSFGSGLDHSRSSVGSRAGLENSVRLPDERRRPTAQSRTWAIWASTCWLSVIRTISRSS